MTKNDKKRGGYDEYQENESPDISDDNKKKKESRRDQRKGKKRYTKDDLMDKWN